MLFFTTIFFFWEIHHVSSSSTIIRDSRATSRDVTPILGRGFSALTAEYFSTCLSAQTTDPTFSYNYNMFELDSEENASSQIQGNLEEDSLCYDYIARTVTSGFAQPTEPGIMTRYAITQMSLEQYYSSVLAETSYIIEPAQDMLNNGDIIGFIQACGPNYINSIVRRGELAGLFKYSASETNTEAMQQFQQRLSNGPEEGISNPVTLGTDLTIAIRVYGLGFNPGAGTSSLFVQSLEDFQLAVDFSFESMIIPKTGVVKSMEILPWTVSPEFQAQARLDIKLTESTCFDTSEVVVECGTDEVANTITTPVPNQLKVFKFFRNAEHLVNLDSILRSRMDRIARLSHCQNALSGLNECQDEWFLLNHQFGTGDYVKNSMRAMELRDILIGISTDPSVTQSSVDYYRWGREISNLNLFVREYYLPCMGVLTEEVEGIQGGNMMLNIWRSVPECSDATCTMRGAVLSLNNGELSCNLPENDPIEMYMEQFCEPVIQPRIYHKCRGDALHPSNILGPNEYICSDDEMYRFGMNNNGAVVTVSNGTVTELAPGGNSDAYITLQTNHIVAAYPNNRVYKINWCGKDMLACTIEEDVECYCKEEESDAALCANATIWSAGEANYETDPASNATNVVQFDESSNQFLIDGISITD